METAIWSKSLQAGDSARQVLSPTVAGTPQGGIGAPVSANLALDGLATRLRTAFPRDVWHGGTPPCAQGNFLCLAADCVLTGALRELLEDEGQPLGEAFLQARGRQRSPAKTLSPPIAEGGDWLGQPMRTDNAQGLLTPSAKRIKTVLRNVRPVMKDTKRATAGRLMRHLHPIMRGWAMYHRQAVSSPVVHSVAPALYQPLWRWAKRRHPHQGGRWVTARDFAPIGDRHWVWAGKARGPQGPLRAVPLLAAQSLPIERHTKSTGEANPSDPPWESYVEKRLALKMAASRTGRRTLRGLWKRQDGCGPHGGEAMTTLTG